MVVDGTLIHERESAEFSLHRWRQWSVCREASTGSGAGERAGDNGFTGKERIEVGGVGLRAKDRFEWWYDVLVEKLVPVDISEEWVGFKLLCVVLCTETMLWISVQ